MSSGIDFSFPCRHTYGIKQVNAVLLYGAGLLRPPPVRSAGYLVIPTVLSALSLGASVGLQKLGRSSYASLFLARTINMGFINGQVESAGCSIAGFASKP